MPKPRPGLPLTEIERLAGLLGDIVDALESLQATDPARRSSLSSRRLRFMRDTAGECARGGRTCASIGARKEMRIPF